MSPCRPEPIVPLSSGGIRPRAASISSRSRAKLRGTSRIGGTRLARRVTVVDFDSGSVQQVDVFGEVEEGWIPPHEGWEHFELLGQPRFVSEHEVLVSPEFGPPIRCELPN